MKIFVGVLLAIIICIVSFFSGLAIKEKEMHNQEIRNILLAQNQLLSLIRNNIDQGKSSEYIKGQLITLQYSGLNFNQSHSDITGFMVYCLDANENQNISDLKDAINQAITITEALRIDSEQSQIKSTLKEFDQFLSNFIFPT